MKNYFIINHNKFHITYKTHIDIEEWIIWASKKFSTIENYSFVNGIGDDTNKYLHTHILVEFKNNIKGKTYQIFDYKLKEDNDYWSNIYWEKYREDDEKVKGIHPNVKLVTDTRYWNNCINYHLNHKTLN